MHFRPVAAPRKYYQDNATPLKDVCSSTSHLRVMNIRTNKMHMIKCKTYACPYCCNAKVYQLREALIQYFSKFEFVRMWTFTMITNTQLAPDVHYKLLVSAWKIFLKEMRRCNAFDDSQKKFQYVKVVELHASGYVHFHALVTQFLDQTVVQKLWERACQQL